MHVNMNKLWSRNLPLLSVALAAALHAGSACAEDKVVKIGFAAPLSGPSAHYGKDLENAIKIALDEANAKQMKIGGSTVHFDLVSEDDQGDPKMGTAVGQRLVDQHVAAVIGHFNSGTSIPASKLYAEAGIPQVSPSATNPALTRQGFKTVYRVINTDAQMGFYAGQYAVKTVKAQRIALIDDRTAFGQGMADEFEKSVRAAGGNIVGREYDAAPTIDFSAILTSLKGRKVDLIFFGGLDAQASALASQMRKLGMDARLMGGGGFTNQVFLDTAGTASEGTLSWEYGLPLASMPGGKGLQDKMKKKFNADIVAYAPFAYDATWAVITAMQKANSTDPKRYAPALASINMQGVTGKIAFEANGDLKDPPATLFEVQNGKWNVVTVASGKP